jgi:carbonic anhydrase
MGVQSGTNSQYDWDQSVSADQALERLMEGHDRFLRGVGRFPTLRRAVLSDLAKGQRPFATVLGCSDSRVPPELIFDACLGELFVVRVAGNTLSPEVGGSLQYAASHLGTALVVVLGHEGCGAVKAALETRYFGTRHRSRIQLLVDGLLPALPSLDLTLEPDVMLARAVESNVRWTMNQILTSPEGQARIEEGQMKLVGAVYELETGRVRWLD